MESCTGIHSIGNRVTYRSLFLKGSPSPFSSFRDGATRAVLLLGGTSVSLEDQLELLHAFAKAGLDVFAIEAPMGGVFRPGMDPRRLRPLCLNDFLGRLFAMQPLKSLDVVTHSYGAYEIVRLLLAAPLRYRPLVRSVLLVNPPGFWTRINLAEHFCHIFVFVYGAMLRRLGRLPNAEKRYAAGQLGSVASVGARALRNPSRTLREINDITGYRLAPPVQKLCSHYGYDFNLFLNARDRLVSARQTLRSARALLPPQRIKVVPGNHFDLLFHEGVRAELISFLRQIRERSRGVTDSGPGGSAPG